MRFSIGSGATLPMTSTVNLQNSWEPEQAFVPGVGIWELQRQRVTKALLIPPLILMFLLFIVPIGLLVWLSFMASGTFSLAGYAELVSPVYLRLLLFTWQLAATVTILCLVISYPIAYLLASIENAFARWMTLALVITLSLSVLARTYSWVIILQRNGIINRALIETGVINSPLSLVYNTLGVHIGMVHVLLPFMILTLVPMLRSINPSLVRSALSLGASPLTAFLRVYFPLSLPGVIAGSMLVFAMAIGFFVTPAILGGGRSSTIVMAIQTQIEVLVDLRLAAATSMILLLITVVVLFLYEKIAGIDRIFRNSR